MVPIKGNWTPFVDMQDQISHYQLWGLIPPKSEKLRPVMVTDGYFGIPEPCKVVGYQTDSWAVIELSDGYHSIHGNYLAELQPEAHQRLPRGLCFAEILSDYIVFDIETTGYSRTHDRIIEIAAISYSYGKKKAEFHSFVNPEMLIPSEITALTGISQIDVIDAPLIEEVEQAFLNFIGDSPLVGHNAVSFDIPFLSAHFSAEIRNPIIDTLPMANNAFSLLPCHKLPYLNDALRLGSTVFHRALHDVETTNALLWACLSPRKYETLVHKAFLVNRLSGTTTDAKKKSTKSKTATSKPFVKQPRYPTVDIKSIKPNSEIVDSSWALFGKSIVFTGDLSLPREVAMQMAVDRGAILRDSISGKTNYLVIGRRETNEPSGKEKRARELISSGKGSIVILNEQEFLELLEKKNTPECGAPQLSIVPSDERKAFELIYPELQDILMGAPIDSGILTFIDLDDFSSVYFLDTSELFFRIRLKKKSRYILISEEFSDLIPDGAEMSRVASAPGMIRIEIRGYEDILKYTSVLRTTLERLCRRHRDFGCCSRYELCSDAKTCLHPDPKFALKCWYRQNLLEGKIFYGKNKNIN